MQKFLLVMFLVVPQLAVAQMVEHNPPAPLPVPTSRDQNNINNGFGNSTRCYYSASSTSSRPRDQSSVVITVMVAPGGRATSADIVESTGSDRLDKASQICALSWRYQLATQSAQPTPVKLEVRWRMMGGDNPSPTDDVGFEGRPVLDGVTIAGIAQGG